MPTTNPTVLQRSIAFDLIRLRHECGLTQAGAAEATGYSEAAINHIETRKRKPQRKLVTALLHAYDRSDLIDTFAERLRLMSKRDWWTDLISDVSVNGFGLYVGLEDGASTLDWWEPLILPGLLQSDAFIESLVDTETVAPRDVLQSRAELRRARREVLTRSENPAQLWAITTEYAVAHVATSDTVRRDQYDHLLEMLRLPNVRLQLVPAGTYVGGATRGPFTILGFGESDPGVVYLETHGRVLWLEQPCDITAHRSAMNDLRACAVGPDDSSALIERYRKEVKA